MTKSDWDARMNKILDDEIQRLRASEQASTRICLEVLEMARKYSKIRVDDKSPS